MGDPALHKYDDDNEDTNSSAYDRARQQWGMDDPSVSDSDDSKETPDNLVSLDQARKRKSDSRGISSDELADAETSGATAEATSADKQENDTSGGGGWKTSTEKGKENSGGFLNSKRKKMGLFIGAAGVTGVLGFTAILGPQLFIANLKELLLERISTVQRFHTRRYRRSKFTTLRNEFSRDGRLGNRMITEMEGRGYTFSFDPNDRNKIIGLTPPGANVSLRGDGIGIHLDDYMEKRHPLRTARWKTKRMNAFYSKFGISRSSVVDKKVRTDGLDDPERIVNKEIAEEVVDDGPEAGTRAREPGDGESDQETADRETSNQQDIDTDNAAGELGDSYGEIREELLDGTPVSEIDNPLVGSLDEVGNGIGENLYDTAQSLATGGSLGGRIFGSVKSFLNPTDLLDRVCTLRNRLRAAQTAGRSIRALKLMRYSSVFINAADAARTGRADPKLVNEVMKRVTSADNNGSPIGASPGFTYLLKERFSKSKNDGTRSQVAVDGRLGGVYQGIKNGTDTVPGMSKCWAIQNPLLQVGTIVIVNGGKALLCAVTAGFGCAATQAAQTAAQQTALQIIKASITSTIEKITIKSIAKSLLFAAATELTFEGAMALTQMYAAKTFELSVTGQERGSTLGDILVAGEGVKNKQRSLVGGMVPATVDEYAFAHADYLAWKQEENKNRSIAERIFDLNNMDSFASKAATATLTNTSNVGTMASSLINSGTGLLNGRIFTSIADNLAGKAYAQNEDEVATDEYVIEGGSRSGTRMAVDFAGNLQMIMRADIESINPDTNKSELIASGDIHPNTLQPMSNDFTEHIKNCVDTIDIISRIEFENNPSDPKKDCLAEHPTTKKYKAHLAYLDMMDSYEAEFMPEEIGYAPGESDISISSHSQTHDTGSVAEATFVPDAQKYLRFMFQRWSLAGKDLVSWTIPA